MGHEGEQIIGNPLRRSVEPPAQGGVDGLKGLCSRAGLPDRRPHPIQGVVTAGAQIEQHGFAIKRRSLDIRIGAGHTPT